MWLVLRIGSKILPYFDRFLDWIIGTQIPKGWTRLTDRCGTQYLDRLKAQCREYEGRGFSGEGLDLERVYVPLGLNSNEPIHNPQDSISPERESTTATGVPESSRVATTALDTTTGALLRKITRKKTAWRRIVILGAPGSGKTTLLRHIALVYALRKQSRFSRRLPHKIPVLLRLRNLTAFILKDVPTGEVLKMDLAAVIAQASKDTKSSPEKVTQLQQRTSRRSSPRTC